MAQVWQNTIGNVPMYSGIFGQIFFEKHETASEEYEEWYYAECQFSQETEEFLQQLQDPLANDGI